MPDISTIAPDEYQTFLRFWGHSYKYDYNNVLSMYERDPRGTVRHLSCLRQGL